MSTESVANPKTRSRLCCLWGALALSLALAFALPGSAGAANVFTLDTSFDGFASVAVNSAGTGFFAWEHRVAGGDDVTMECTVARGSTCTTAQTLPTPPVGFGSSVVSQPFVVLGGGSTVYVVGPRYIASDVVLWTSTDGGMTWGVASVAQTGAYKGGSPSNALLAGSGFDISSHNPGMYFTSVPTSGPGPANGADLTPAANPGVRGSTLGLVAGNPLEAVSLLAAAGSQHSTVNFTSYSGSGGPNNAANWTPLAHVSDGIAPSLAGGPGGLFLASEDYAGAGGSATQVNVRKYNGSGFGAPVTIQSDTSNDGNGSLYQTPNGGQLLAAWQGATRADGILPIRLYRSTDGGNTFTLAGDIATTTTANTFISAIRLAAADDGLGFVSFVEGAQSALRVADLTPPQPPQPPPPPPAQITARFTYTTQASGLCAGNPIAFNAGASRSSQGPITHYFWRFDDDSPVYDAWGNVEKIVVGHPSGPDYGPAPVVTYDFNRSQFYGYVDQYYVDISTPPALLALMYRDPVDVALTVEDDHGNRASITQTLHFVNDSFSFLALLGSHPRGSVGPDRLLPEHPALFGPIHPECAYADLARQRRGHAAALKNDPVAVSGSTATVAIGCPGTLNCYGTTRLSLASVKATLARRRTRPPRGALGLAVFDIPAGKTVNVQVALSTSSLRVLRLRHPRKLVVEVRTIDPTTGKGTTVKKALKFVVTRKDKTKR